jgi:hypothetical protein
MFDHVDASGEGSGKTGQNQDAGIPRERDLPCELGQRGRAEDVDRRNHDPEIGARRIA